MLLLSLVSKAALADGQGYNQLTNRTDAKSLCSQYGALFTNIDMDLARWKARGISLDLMQRTAERNTARSGRASLSPYQRCFLAGFRGGRAYLMEEIDLERIGHHAVGVHTMPQCEHHAYGSAPDDYRSHCLPQVMFFVYMRMLLHLERSFVMPDVVGAALPPLSTPPSCALHALGCNQANTPFSYMHPHYQDLVISTQDRPIGLSLDPSGDDEPVFRFCKGESHADIMIPNFHFHMVRGYLSYSQG
jgi:hypothetical protein